MFTDKKFYMVNREERHFELLLVSELLNNGPFREKFFQLLSQVTGVSLSPHDFDIYTEVVALRDYWHALGNPIEYSQETHDRRYAIIRELLDDLGYQDTSIDEHSVFWTTENPDTRKLWCPAKWNISELKKLEKNANDLVSIRWCFNAKPDVMIDCRNAFVFLEIKVESKEGKNEHGYNQFEIQNQIAELMQKFVPAFRKKTFKQTTLTLDDQDGILWKEVIELLVQHNRKNVGYDKVMQGLMRLQQYL